MAEDSFMIGMMISKMKSININPLNDYDYHLLKSFYLSSYLIIKRGTLKN